MCKRIIITLLASLGILGFCQSYAQGQPVANDDVITVTKGACQVNIPVTQNDLIQVFPGGDQLQLVDSLTPVALLSVNANTDILYCLIDTGFVGVDSFEYQICDTVPVFGFVCDTATVTVFVLPLNPSTGLVWPGDANSDGVADVYDLLPIGRNHSRFGPSRSGPPSIQWRDFVAPFWNDTLLNGANLHHADCNGDGQINTIDTLAIALNYGLTHPKTSGTNGDCAIDPPLFVDVIGPPTLAAGDTVRLRISLGTPAIPASQAYSAALSIEYNLPVLKEEVKRDMSSSWLYGNFGGPPSAISMVRHLDSSQRIDVAITRINHQPAMAGSGEIGTIIVIIDDNLSGKTASIEDLTFNIGRGEAVQASGQSFDLCLKGDTTKIDMSTGIRMMPEDLGFRLIPNPADEELTVSWTEEEMNLIELVDMRGQVIRRIDLEGQANSNHKLDLSGFAPGLYLVRISGDQAFAIKKLIIKQ